MFPLFNIYGSEQEPVYAETVAFVLVECKTLGLDDELFDVIKMGMKPGDDPAKVIDIINQAIKTDAT